MIKKYFGGLRTRLTLTYMLVTVSALLTLLIMLLGAVFTLITISGGFATAYLQDIDVVNNIRTVSFVRANDIDGLQHWMDGRYAAGNASEPPVDMVDSPLARFSFASDFYFVDNTGIVRAQSPTREDVGQRLPLPASVQTNWAAILPEPYDNPLDNRYVLPDGDWFYIFPVWEGEETFGAMALTVEPVPPMVSSMLPLIGTIVGGSAFVLLLGVAPFAALVGYLMAHNLTRRLARLEAAADAYSRGEFDVVPEESSVDEIGRLATRLQQMAQQIAALLQNRQDLTLLEERNRMARELHDTVKQQNFATLMQIRAAKNLAGQGLDADVALGHLESAETLLKQSQQDLKDVIEELRPAQLDGHGLPTALRQFATGWATQNGITVNVAINGERSLSLPIEQTLYRVVQEAFANIARHSVAGRVELTLHYHPKTVSLTIADNGRGFDPQTSARGFGLSTMRQRITNANGTLTVTSEPDQGTTITAEITG